WIWMRNIWMLIYPRYLAADWTADSIPLIQDSSDQRIIAVAVFYAVFFFWFARLIFGKRAIEAAGEGAPSRASDVVTAAAAASAADAGVEEPAASAADAGAEEPAASAADAGAEEPAASAADAGAEEPAVSATAAGSGREGGEASAEGEGEGDAGAEDSKDKDDAGVDAPHVAFDRGLRWELQDQVKAARPEDAEQIEGRCLAGTNRETRGWLRARSVTAGVAESCGGARTLEHRSKTAAQQNSGASVCSATVIDLTVLLEHAARQRAQVCSGSSDDLTVLISSTQSKNSWAL
ncbi:hypothetical protein CYMTET_30990, partial [Cymbomonas tetramitiformis]